MNILTNEKKNNHLNYLKKMAVKANKLIVVSPFVTDDISKLLDDMTTIKNITLYTTLQKYDNIPQQVIALYKFCEYCKKMSIDLHIKIDDNLHGKVYLFYNGVKPKGFVLTSGNFTENGLINNHEYGICIEDVDKQKEMYDIINAINTYDLSYTQLCDIYDSALKFIEKYPAVKPEKFKVDKLINKKTSVTQNGTKKYFLKPVGTSQEPFERVIKDRDKIGFSKRPRKIQKGDVLLLHGVGASCIVGYYGVISDEPVDDKINDNDKWKWKVEVECYSSYFSEEWREYKLKTQKLVDEFLETNPKNYITMAGGRTLGTLQRGNGYVQITEEFAQFIIDKIS